MKKNTHKWLFTRSALASAVGMGIGQMMIGEFNFGMSIGAVLVALVFFIIDLIRHKRKKDHTPDVDERTTQNMLKFIAYSSNAFILLFFLSLAFFTLQGYEKISILYMWIALGVYFFISGVGALIVSKK